MILPSHALALDLRLFEAVLESRGGGSAVTELVGEPYTEFLGIRDCTLDCPREEILVSPSPSFIFVMDEELLGVYPTPTGVYIRKPLERGEEVMVLQPGFKGNAVYYYDSKRKCLVVLCNRNRGLIHYKLQPDRPPHPIMEVLGLPRASDYRRSALQMVCSGPFIFTLFGFRHVFCIDRSHPRRSVQAHLIWSNGRARFRAEQLLVSPTYPKGLRVLLRNRTGVTVVRLRMKSRRAPLYFKERPHQAHDLYHDDPFGARLCMVYPIDDNIYALATYHNVDGRPRECWLELRDRMFRFIGDPVILSPEYVDARDMQIVSGPNGVIYILRDDSSFSPSFMPEDEWSSDSEGSYVSDHDTVDMVETVRDYVGREQSKRISVYYPYMVS
ncbi:hypothetical protein FOL47_009594 [Perkinsus chesapeaki]|uniref:Uncharacterized protein n=1 Tax=Perkinsus chesapeaki TaxID=330153 RepID=A0A7J6MRG3_PERCH|nr:hypothetical protein FOL47_009594 [Perkinsus chesapeaki]